LLLLCNQGMPESDIPHRSKLSEAILSEWDSEFDKLKARLKSTQGKISFTADIWSDSRLRPFLAITAHWIEQDAKKDLSLQAALI
ncbi:uncharacterized protein EI90DRAFT_2893140, partial [Cantharellus anzutake]|uniref:uncharacterized protein n=1 Tax=Cantharellus anzutake TaxID=1750568 RepID=UPI0019089F73